MHHTNIYNALLLLLLLFTIVLIINKVFICPIQSLFTQIFISAAIYYYW